MMRYIMILITLIIGLIAEVFIGFYITSQPDGVFWRCCDMDEQGTVFIASHDYLIIYKEGKRIASLPTTTFPYYMFYEKNNKLFLVTSFGVFELDSKNYPDAVTKTSVNPYDPNLKLTLDQKSVDKIEDLRKHQYDKKKKTFGEIQLHSFLGYKWVEYGYQGQNGVIYMQRNIYVLEILFFLSAVLWVSSGVYLFLHFKDFNSFLNRFFVFRSNQ